MVSGCWFAKFGQFLVQRGGGGVGCRKGSFAAIWDCGAVGFGGGWKTVLRFKAFFRRLERFSAKICVPLLCMSIFFCTFAAVLRHGRERYTGFTDMPW